MLAGWLLSCCGAVTGVMDPKGCSSTQTQTHQPTRMSLWQHSDALTNGFRHRNVHLQVHRHANTQSRLQRVSTNTQAATNVRNASGTFAILGFLTGYKTNCWGANPQLSHARVLVAEVSANTLTQHGLGSLTDDALALMVCF